MKREFLTTGDGSLTIHLPDWNEQYHSKHGAIKEAQHVFLQAGLQFYIEKYAPSELNILEIGFGTGLNAFLTQQFSEENKVSVNYTGVEAYPVLMTEIEKLNYPKLLNFQTDDFLKLHQTSWENIETISAFFKLCKRKQFFSEIQDEEAHNIIYFDAFGARVQPELWTEEIFKIMYGALRKNGVLVTYAAKGSVRRAMEAVGFNAERLPGPPGKREMLRAVK